MVTSRVVEILVRIARLTAICGAIVLASCSHPMSPLEPQNEVIVGDKDNEKTIALIQGGILVVRLESQPSTGYVWRVENIDRDRLEFLGETREVHWKIHPGGTEYQAFRFKALTAGSTSVELDYLRPWEKDEPPAEIFKINLEIQAGN